MVKIVLLRGDRGGVESEVPIQISEAQFEKIKKGFKNSFSVVHIEDEMVTGRRMQVNKLVIMPWKVEDYYHLLSPEFDLNEKAASMGRHPYGVLRMYIKESPEFEKFAKQKNLPSISIETIRIYLKEKKEEKKRRAKERSQYDAIFICKKCGREYLASRFSNKTIISPNSCDFDGRKLVERRKKKDEIEKGKNDGRIKESYPF